MEKILKKQKDRQEAITKGYTNFKKDSEERKTRSYLTTRIQNLQENWDYLRKGHDTIIDMCEDYEHEYFKKEIYIKTEEIYIDFLSALTERLGKFEASNSPRNQSTAEQTIVVQHNESGLPKIQLPIFDGNYQSWVPFRDLYLSVVGQNNDISNVQKLHHLKTHLSGEAERLVRHISIISDNYDVAWECLKQRYENKRVLVNSYLQSFFSQPSLNIETAQGLRRIIDQTNQSLKGIENLGINTKSWDTLILYVVVQRLPAETHKAWEQKLGSKTDLPVLKDLFDFLNARFRALEAVSLNESKRTGQGNQLPLSKGHNSKVKSFHITNQTRCNLCKGPHALRQCSKFLQMNVDERSTMVRRKGLCNNCLAFGHLLANCPSSKSCFKCGKRHHTTIHKGGSDSDSKRNEHLSTKDMNIKVVEENNQETKEDIQSYFAGTRNEEKGALLATAVVLGISLSGEEIALRALLDQGSEASFITEDAAQRLKLKRSSVSTTISGLGASKLETLKTKVHVEIKSRIKDVQFGVNAFILRKLTALLPSKLIQPGKWEHLKNLTLADPRYNEPGHIDLLLGADIYADILEEGVQRGPKGSPIAQRTSLGWVVFGQYQNHKEDKRNKITALHVNVELSKQIKRFWEIEEIDSPRKSTTEEVLCEKLYKETVARDPDGRYIVQLPFKSFGEKQRLGKSRDIAIIRLLQMERRLKGNLELRKQYSDCINEYLTLGHLVPARTKEENHCEQDTEGNIRYSSCYLPHHAVIKDSSTTTRLRVVFNASQKTQSGISLNDTLIKGPTIQDDIISILIRWRMHKIAFTADITKMYRQIKVNDQNTNFQRIVWRNSESESIKDYCLTTVTFATNSAPFLAIRTLHQLAADEVGNYPIGAQTLIRDFYVDDLMSGSDNVEEAIKIQKDITQILRKGGFEIRKWKSNSETVLKKIPENDVEMTNTYQIEADEWTKALGIYWCPRIDLFGFKTNFGEIGKVYTKRKILSDIAKLFDPLGWLTPMIIRAKVFMQRIWLSGFEWDDEVEGDILNDWMNFRSSLHLIQDIQIPRWVSYTANDPVQIHGFCDASQVAFAAAVYLRVIKSSTSIHTHLLIAKSRVAPLKRISLPRLELCGAALLAKLIQKVRGALNLKKDIKIYTWTDSTIVLAWIKGQPHRWKTFVANKISDIHGETDAESWRHIPSADNPADPASRGIPINQLNNLSLWWNGPAWLQKDENHWPKSKHNISTDEESKEVIALVNQLPNPENEDLLNKFSSLTKLLRVTSYIFRVIYSRRKEKSPTTWLTSHEVQEARKYWEKYAQASGFHHEIRVLKKGQRIERKSKILNLNPFVDQNGILRIGGRLQNSDLPLSQKHLIILPEKSRFTDLVIDHAHKTTLHGGPQLMLNIIQKRYWLINARNKLRHYVHKCIQCYRQKAKTMTQLMGNLPSPRAKMSRPFTHTGVDYCGPFNIKATRLRSAKVIKGYVALFVCLSVKAIHIELVSDLSSQAFIAALRRFLARRGLCSHLYSDCGTNFIGANNMMKSEHKKLMAEVNKEIAEECTKREINWHFNPPASPHFGGLWEIGVKSIKHHLRRVVGNNILTFEELTTVLTQIEACLNSRPLCPLNSDPEDEQALTPGHFLIGEALLAPPERNLLEINENMLNKWQLLQRIYQHFWKRWSNEYLARMQQRPKWMVQEKNVKPGNLVLIREDDTPPMKWHIGRILKVHPGTDSFIRVVTVRTQGTNKLRPITKISLLPIPENTDPQR